MPSKRKPSADSAAWDQCLNAADRLSEWSFFSLGAEAGVTNSIARGVVGEWEAQGVIERLGKRGPKNRLHFRFKEGQKPDFKRAVQSAAPQQSAEQNMWTAMRIMPHFTPIDLTAHCTTEIVQVDLNAARRFCRLLLEAGYVRVQQKALPGKREATYRLIRNTGPKAPQVRRVQVVYDGNTLAPAYVPEVSV